jgi:hypothetical protein
MNIEQTNKFFIDASFNHLIEVKNNGDALLTIHNDGTITAAEHLSPTETAAEVLRIMRETWMADAQSIKIRDQQERIKRLEEAANETIKLAAKHIKQLVDGGDEAIYKTNLFDREERWNKAKEAKP